MSSPNPSKTASGLPGRDAAVDPVYMPQPDALRGLALIGVMSHHFNPNGIASTLLPLRLGVHFFFTLSGFLITSILLRCRDLVDQGNQGWGITIWRFYVRRFLRIFPVYYMTLGLVCLSGIPQIRHEIWWFLAYVSNMNFHPTHEVRSYLGHFWSLAVEEQFYLFWPWIVILAPRRWLVPAVVVGLLIGPLYRLRTELLGWPLELRELSSFSTLANIDIIAAGAALALLWKHFGLQQRNHPARRWIWIVGFGSAAVFAVPLLVLRAMSLFSLHSRDFPDASFVVFNSLMALVFVAVVDAAAIGIRGPIGVVLNWKPLRYLGKISYGVYVIHLPLGHLLAWGLPKIHLELPGMGPKRFLVCGGISIAMGAASWHFLEGPVNSLKRHFPYKVRKKAPASLAIA